MDVRDRAAAQLLTAEEVAAQFGINVKTVRKWQHRRKVWAVKKGRDWLFWRKDWERLAREAEISGFPQNSRAGS